MSNKSWNSMKGAGPPQMAIVKNTVGSTFTFKDTSLTYTKDRVNKTQGKTPITLSHLQRSQITSKTLAWTKAQLENTTRGAFYSILLLSMKGGTKKDKEVSFLIIILSGKTIASPCSQPKKQTEKTQKTKKTKGQKAVQVKKPPLWDIVHHSWA